eukprot:1160397-Pelagomonas_calceolata.AAC.5
MRIEKQEALRIHGILHGNMLSCGLYALHFVKAEVLAPLAICIQLLRQYIGHRQQSIDLGLKHLRQQQQQLGRMGEQPPAHQQQQQSGRQQQPAHVHPRVPQINQQQASDHSAQQLNRAHTLQPPASAPSGAAACAPSPSPAPASAGGHAGAAGAAAAQAAPTAPVCNPVPAAPIPVAGSRDGASAAVHLPSPDAPPHVPQAPARTSSAGPAPAAAAAVSTRASSEPGQDPGALLREMAHTSVATPPAVSKPEMLAQRALVHLDAGRQALGRLCNGLIKQVSRPKPAESRLEMLTQKALVHALKGLVKQACCAAKMLRWVPVACCCVLCCSDSGQDSGAPVQGFAKQVCSAAQQLL